jgi:hypothetical protein
MEYGDKIHLDNFIETFKTEFLESLDVYVVKDTLDLFYFHGNRLEFECVGNLLESIDDYDKDWTENVSVQCYKQIVNIIKEHHKVNPKEYDLITVLTNFENLFEED